MQDRLKPDKHINLNLSMVYRILIAGLLLWISVYFCSQIFHIERDGRNPTTIENIKIVSMLTFMSVSVYISFVFLFIDSRIKIVKKLGVSRGAFIIPIAVSVLFWMRRFWVLFTNVIDGDFSVLFGLMGFVALRNILSVAISVCLCKVFLHYIKKRIMLT